MIEPTLDIFCCKVTDIDATLLRRYFSLLNATERQRYAAYRSTAAQTEFVISRALLRTTLATRLHCAPDAIQYTRNADGKPQLDAPFAHWHFNLSHSCDWVVLALSQSGPVGVDVENHERSNNLARIAQRYFSATENASLALLNDEAWIQRFFAIWTLKEAHAKALGCGLSKILSCSSFVIDIVNRTIDLQLSANAAAATCAASWLYRLAANTSLAVSQINTPQAATHLHRSMPLTASGNAEIYLELMPIATGNWSTDGIPTQAAKPRA